jgi:hypothetical protein
MGPGAGTAVESARWHGMKKLLSPDPNPIPPEMPADPSRMPAPDMPINTPPEKGPGRPEPMPLGPSRPTPVARAGLASAVALALLVSAPAWAQHSVGKDTSALEHGNPQQTQCSQIMSREDRQRCLKQNQPSGAPATGKRTDAPQPRETKPGIGQEVRPVPYKQTQTPTNPDPPTSQSR